MLKDGGLWMAFGTPGGDVQTRAMLQVLLNIVEFGMSVQQAIEAPRFGTLNFPNSFAPHEYRPGRLYVEEAVPAATRSALSALGHDVQPWPTQTPNAGAVCAIVRQAGTGLLHAGADSRREGYALAW